MASKLFSPNLFLWLCLLLDLNVSSSQSSQFLSNLVKVSQSKSCKCLPFQSKDHFYPLTKNSSPAWSQREIQSTEKSDLHYLLVSIHQKIIVWPAKATANVAQFRNVSTIVGELVSSLFSQSLSSIAYCPLS
jgi:hypothetical protein